MLIRDLSSWAMERSVHELGFRSGVLGRSACSGVGCGGPRWRVYELAPLFEVSVSYIYKALARRRDLGLTTALPRKGRPGRKLDRHLDALVARVKANLDATLEELRASCSSRRRVSSTSS